jgi:hypothetical protein
LNSYAPQKHVAMSKAAANSYAQTKNERPSPFQLVQRSETIAQPKLGEELNQSTRGESQIQLEQMLNGSPRVVAQAKLAETLSAGKPTLQPQQPIQRREALEDQAIKSNRVNETAMQRRKRPIDHEPPRNLSQAVQARNKTGLPDKLKAGMENLSGIPLDDVKVEYNSAKPAQYKALAITQGNNIDIGPGLERYLPHEAWHAVQQKQGRVMPTMQMGGAAVNDDSALEREADIMGARALSGVRSQEQELVSVQLQSEPVIQRAMGMEIETRRAVTTPGGKKIEAGDSELLEHRYFRLVTDKFSGYSNLEFVMKHFNQLAGTEGEAILELRTRIAAMKSLWDSLYAAEGRLGTIVGNIGTGLTDIYAPKQVTYEGEEEDVDFAATEARIKAPAADDRKLYVHYTVGFEPKHWFKMVQDIQAVTRADTEKSRPRTHVGQALGVVPKVLAAIDTSTLNATEREELRGHLALLYMQMSVFVERTLDLALKLLEKQKKKLEGKIKELNEQIAEIALDTRLNPMDKDEQTEKVERKKRLRKREMQTLNQKIKDVKAQMAFNKGLAKNKIAALPRASLAQVFTALSPKVRVLLTANKDTIIDVFSDHLESQLKLDLPEQFELESEEGVSASLVEYLEAGFGSGTQISQQVLFGGMKEVGIDTSVFGKTLLPLEFRSLFDQRVTWPEMEAHAIKILKWSRDPEHVALI